MLDQRRPAAAVMQGRCFPCTRLAAALLCGMMLLPAHAEDNRRAFAGYYPSWSEATWHLEATPTAYTHVVVAFARPDFTWDGRTWKGTGLQFASAPGEIQRQIIALKQRHITVLLAVGGATYLDWAPLAAEAAKPGPVTAALAKFVTAMGFDGIEADYEPEGATPERVAEYRAGIRALRQATGPGKLLTLAAWPTGADCTAETGAAACGGKAAPAKGRNGRERLLFRDQALFAAIDMINVMSYDAGVEHFDPVKAWALYRDLVPSRVTVNVGFETAPESWGGARLVAGDAAALCPGSVTRSDQFGEAVNKPYAVSRILREGPLTARKNSNPQDGAMLWHMLKDQDLPLCGNAAAASPRDVQQTVRGLLDRAGPAPLFKDGSRGTGPTRR
jgi:hypothetical protein